MFTTDERRALVFLAVVTAVGAAFRASHGGGAPAASVAAVAPELPGGDLVRQAALSQRAQAVARPLAPGERVDVDRAPADELQRLPRVGPALARRIVEEREAHGPFGSLDGLRRVTGIGPKLLRDLEAHVTFGGVPPAAVAPDAFATQPRLTAVMPGPGGAHRAPGVVGLGGVGVGVGGPAIDGGDQDVRLRSSPRSQPCHGGGTGLPAGRRPGARRATRGRADGARTVPGHR